VLPPTRYLPERFTNPNTPCSRPQCQQALADARCRAAYYQALHRRATQREANLKQQLQQLQAQQQQELKARWQQREQTLRQQIDELQAEVRLLKQRLYGSKSESHHHPNALAHDGPETPGAATNHTTATTPTPRRRRGQQRGRPSHGRRRYDHLPATHETLDLPPEQRHCTTCGLPFTPWGSEPQHTTLLEITVRAHRRVLRRRRYRPACSCGTHPNLISVPTPRLLPKSALGVSVWVAILLDKYAFYRPTYRLLAEWRLHGLDLSLGTITDGLQRLVPLFEPLDEALRTHNQQQTHWHGDETRWHVFATVEGKSGYHWYLWLVRSAAVTVFTLASGRGHEVPETILGPEAHGLFNVDRYAAYPAMQQVQDGQVTLALCWAHQRRDFIEAERGHPELHAWAAAWLTRISHLYQLNDARVQVWQKDAAAFAVAQQHVQAAVQEMAATAQQQQAQADLPAACRKVLSGMLGYWPGLTVFVDHPEVPLDNNAAERAERGPVVGRKNYYGSGALWSGQLAAMLFSLLATVRQWGLNEQQWLTGYLSACAAQGGQALSDVRGWLPWSMTTAERAALKLEAPVASRRATDSS
jgi:transposase